MEDLENNFDTKSSERNIVIKVNRQKDINSNNNIIFKSVNILGNERKENLKESNSKEISSNHKKISNKSFIFNAKGIKSSFLSFSSSNMKSSSKIKKFHLPIFDDDKYSKNKSEIMSSNNNYCQICEEELTNEELNDNFVGCFHIFCDDCYYNYLKEKINNNNVEKIKCPYYNCSYFLYNNFIERKIVKDIPLLKKYKKLLKRKQLMINPKIQLCPYPDCESYAKKEENNKFVSCIENKHKFCFNCLKDWHNNEECKIDVEKSFKNWKDSTKVKRCPRCKYFIEKNGGCNHITCFNCKYNWCWLCLQECKPNHYDNGICFGLQYAKSTCFSNMFCLISYQILIFIAKNIGFAILGSGFFFVIIYYLIYDNFHGDNINCLSKIISFICIFNLYISLSGILLSLSTFVSILMLLIWPLHKLIFKIIDKIL
jgi:hypothetical protein